MCTAKCQSDVTATTMHKVYTEYTIAIDNTGNWKMAFVIFVLLWIKGNWDVFKASREIDDNDVSHN